MTAVKLTKAQARALGIAPSTDVAAPAGQPPARSRRKPAARRDRSVADCVDCDARLIGEAAQRRHTDDTGHCRQQLVLEP